MSCIWNDQDYKSLVESCGGKDNILEVENCTTRLRIGLKNMERDGKISYDKDKLSLLPGVKLVMIRGNSVQLVMGLDVLSLEKECKKKLGL